MLAARKLKPVSDPAREELAAAIAKLAGLRAEIASHERTLQEAWEAQIKADDAVSAAREAVKEASALERRAKAAALEEAEARSSDQAAHRKELAAKGHETQQHLGWAEAALRDRLSAVAQPVTAALVAEYRRKQEELQAVGATLNFLRSRGCLRHEDMRFDALRESTYFAPEAAYVQWVEALARDPYAPAPGA